MMGRERRECLGLADRCAGVRALRAACEERGGREAQGNRDGVCAHHGDHRIA